MFSHLQIYNPRERAVVGAADLALNLGAAVARRFRRDSRATPSRVLLLRLERIGDLLMVLGAIRQVRAILPAAEIDLVIGSWNAGLAALLEGITGTELLDASWLSREPGALTYPQLIARARSWRKRHYDLAINFEPDIRSNLLTWLSGARRRIGYSSAGGGGFLTQALRYDPRLHVSDNAMRLAAAALGSSETKPAAVPDGRPLLAPPPSPAAARLIEGHRGMLIGVHASGGRLVKQWTAERFRQLAARLIDDYDATIVLTGSAADRPLVTSIASGLPRERIIDVAGSLDLASLAWLLSQLRLLVTGDTGPMHLAHSVGTPVVAVFGPSDPVRYGPRGPRDRIIRIDLPCSPCNRIRQPPARCTGHTPDCLMGISVDVVMNGVATVVGFPVELRQRVDGGRG
jgi:ADP-heptose:LPS heptosyltransferase